MLIAQYYILKQEGKCYRGFKRLKTKGKRQRTNGLSISPLSFFGRSGEAVGLSAISFSAALQKDAAPIPNALAATNSMVLSLTFMSLIL